MSVELMRDLLDNQVIDRHGEKMGKVDGIILSITAGRPPRVVAIELGATTLAARVHPRLGRWLERAVRRWHLPIGRTRIPWRRVLHVGKDVRVALDGKRTRVHGLELWLRTHVIGRMPWAG